jgi:glutamate racemase
MLSAERRSEQSALPIGVFDSGLGGLDVAAAISKLLPDERLLYWGDNARVPYGTKSSKIVQTYAYEAGRALVSRGVKAVVIACNTASAVVDLNALSVELGVPVFGMIEAGVRACDTALSDRGSSTTQAHIVVLATPGTIASHAYQDALSSHDAELRVSAIACPLIVPLVEAGWARHELAPQIIAAQLEEREVADRLRVSLSQDEAHEPIVLLGCTHYPLIADAIRRGFELSVGRTPMCVDGAESAAHMIKSYLQSSGLSAHPDADLKRHSAHLAYFTDDLSGAASLELAQYFWQDRGGVGDLELLSAGALSDDATSAS